MGRGWWGGWGVLFFLSCGASSTTLGRRDGGAGWSPWQDAGPEKPYEPPPEDDAGQGVVEVPDAGVDGGPEPLPDPLELTPAKFFSEGHALGLELLEAQAGTRVDLVNLVLWATALRGAGLYTTTGTLRHAEAGQYPPFHYALLPSDHLEVVGNQGLEVSILCLRFEGLSVRSADDYLRQSHVFECNFQAVDAGTALDMTSDYDGRRTLSALRGFTAGVEVDLRETSPVGGGWLREGTLSLDGGRLTFEISESGLTSNGETEKHFDNAVSSPSARWTLVDGGAHYRPSGLTASGAVLRDGLPRGTLESDGSALFLVVGAERRAF